MRINLARLKNNILELGKIGQDKEGGITRIGFSPLEQEAQEWLIGKFRELELDYKRDSVGNLIAFYPGKNDLDIIIGSHLDTVPQGGMFDGALGVLAALELIETLIDNDIKLDYNIRLVAFVAEEASSFGGTFGSRAAASLIEEIDDDSLAEIALTNKDIQAAKFDKDSIKAYLELHIEQGGILEKEKKDIGIVSGIVGIQRYSFTINGFANHAGTTPMDLRDDALIKATYFIQDFYELINTIKDKAVGTIGYLKLKPGAANVIPGKVELTIEMRSMEFSLLDDVFDRLVSKYPNYEYQKIIRKEPSVLSQEIISKIEEATKELAFSYKIMASGAGHDAKAMSEITPTAMIFVPSVKGISHSPKEFSHYSDIEKAVNVLLKVVTKIK